MFIHTEDMDTICKKMEEALIAGSTWMAYPAVEFLSSQGDLKFFRTEDEAKDYCISNHSDYDSFSRREIQPVLDALREKIRQDNKREDVEYYFVSGQNEVNTTLKTNSDQNSLHNSEGNGFTDAWIEHSEHYHERRAVKQSAFLDEERKTAIEAQLLKYPITELENKDTKANLVDLIGKGENPMVELEKRLIPESLIAWYALMEHIYPAGSVYESGHSIKPIGTYRNIDEANEFLGNHGEEILRQGGKSDSELMLIGRYHNQQLQYTYDMQPEPHTGLLIATATINQGKYESFIHNDPDKETTIKEHLFVSADFRGHLRFNDGVNERNVDLDFWNGTTAKLEQSVIEDASIQALQAKPLQDNLSDLLTLLKSAGFKIQKDELEKHMQKGQEHFNYSLSHQFEEENVRYHLHFAKNEQQEYYFEGYNAVLQKAIEIKDITINGVNSKELELRMKTVDWSKHGNESIGSPKSAFMEQIISDLSKLDNKNKILLQAKFWTDTSFGQEPIKKEIFDLLKRNNQYQESFIAVDGHCLNASQSYQLLRSRSELIGKLLDTIPSKTIISSFKTEIMNEKNFESLKNSFKFMGFGDRVNADVERNIRSGAAEFTVSDSTEFYNGNRRMNSELHIKRGEQNDSYFWNKYDATLLKADGSSSLSQTFYLNLVKKETEDPNKPEYRLNGFTLKEAANLLDGRFVHKTFTKSNGEQYDAWRAIDFSAKDDNGNYKYDQIHQNFGYNVEKAIRKESFAASYTPEQVETLAYSLKKGNLHQVVNSNGEKMFIQADPESGKANRLLKFDSDMKEITTELRNVKQLTPESKIEKDTPKKMAPGENKNETVQNDLVTGKGRGKGKTNTRESTTSSSVDELLPKNEGKKKRDNSKTAEKGGGDDLLVKNDTAKSKSKRP